MAVARRGGVVPGRVAGCVAWRKIMAGVPSRRAAGPASCSEPRTRTAAAGTRQPARERRAYPAVVSHRGMGGGQLSGPGTRRRGGAERLADVTSVVSPPGADHQPGGGGRPLTGVLSRTARQRGARQSSRSCTCRRGRPGTSGPSVRRPLGSPPPRTKARCMAWAPHRDHPCRPYPTFPS